MNKKILTVFITVIQSYHNLIAQDTLPARLNFKFEYETGLQFFNMGYTEEVQASLLRENMPLGAYYIDKGYKPTAMHSYYLSSAFFKNKTYYITAGLHYFKNETTSYGFTTDNFGNPLKKTSRSWFDAACFSWGLKKEINLKKYGVFIPRICFMQYFNFEGKIEQRETISNKSTGEIISDKKLPINGIPLLVFSGNILMFFDDPRIGFEYQKNIYKGFHLGMSYTYHFGGSMQNLYRNATSWDLSGQNISVMIGYKLFNK